MEASNPPVIPGPRIPEAALRMLLERTRLKKGEVNARLKQAMNPAYWRSLLPDAPPALGDAGSHGCSGAELAELRQRFDARGYFQVPGVVPPAMVERLLACVRAVENAGWPPVFACVYDELWEAYRLPHVRTLTEQALGPGYRQLPNVWVFHVEPRPGGRGWAPHTDGSTNMYGRASVWLPLTHATLDNGCMYVIPQDRGLQDLAARFTSVEAPGFTYFEVQALLQNCRALPAEPGDFLCWNFHLIHWGSACSGGGAPRISIAFEFIDAAHEPFPDESPLVIGMDGLPTFQERLQAIAAGILSYVRFDPVMIRWEGLAQRLADAAQ